jgi:16S rRNA (guanine527-N7)-methyltransferase
VEQSDIITNSVSRETFDYADQLIEDNRQQLESYLDQLLWWNERVNLVSRDVSRETIWNHIRHSLLLSNFKEFQSSNVIVDAGTGGGLPGIPLAITHPQKHIILNDLVTKKCLVIKQMAKKMKLKNVAIVDGFIEDFSYDDSFLLISKHAFKVNQLYNMTSSLPWSKMIFYKGTEFSDELKSLPHSLKVRSHELSNGDPFFEGKALVIVERD